MTTCVICDQPTDGRHVCPDCASTHFTCDVTDIHRVLAGDIEPDAFADNLFLWLPDPPAPPPEVYEHQGEMHAYEYEEDGMAPAMALAQYALEVADYVHDNIASAPFFQARAEADIAIAMLHRLAQWLAGEHHDPIPAPIAGIIAEISLLLHAIYNHYEAGWARDNDPPEP